MGFFPARLPSFPPIFVSIFLFSISPVSIGFAFREPLEKETAAAIVQSLARPYVGAGDDDDNGAVATGKQRHPSPDETGIASSSIYGRQLLRRLNWHPERNALWF